jgi:hypothetical protein
VFSVARWTHLQDDVIHVRGGGADGVAIPQHLRRAGAPTLRLPVSKHPSAAAASAVVVAGGAPQQFVTLHASSEDGASAAELVSELVQNVAVSRYLEADNARNPPRPQPAGSLGLTLTAPSVV